MKIYNHHIRTTDIIGISPLMLNQRNTNPFRYIQYFFVVYTTHQSIRIESEEVNITFKLEENNKQEIEVFKAEFKRVQPIILELIGEEPAAEKEGVDLETANNIATL